eukprot:4995561-Pyramimonas_sp.AAC.1
MVGTCSASSGITRPGSERTPSWDAMGWTGLQPGHALRSICTRCVESQVDPLHMLHRFPGVTK